MNIEPYFTLGGEDMNILARAVWSVSQYIVRQQIAYREKRWAAERGDQCLFCCRRGNHTCLTDECVQILAIDAKNRRLLSELYEKLEKKGVA